MVHDLDLAALALTLDGDAVVLEIDGRALRLEATDSPPDTLGFVAKPRG